jgi:integrase
MSADLAELLTRFKMDAYADGANDGSPVWTGRGRRSGATIPNEPMIPDAMSRRIKRLIRNAGLVEDDGRPLATAHDLRRTGASLAAAAGVPEVILQHQLGHATSETTKQFYVRRADEAMQDEFAGAFT